jgi:hypothetical protein
MAARFRVTHQPGKGYHFNLVATNDHPLVRQSFLAVGSSSSACGAFFLTNSLPSRQARWVS